MTRPPAAANVAETIDRSLRRVGVKARAEGEKRYLKSDLIHYGVSKPKLRAVVRTTLVDAEPLTHRRLLAIVRALWARPVFERRAAAVDLLDRFPALLAPADMVLLERLIRQSKTWALVDWIAIPVVGPLVDRHPAVNRTLDRWARDGDFWVRRSALIALLRPLRRGEGDFARFGRYADAMLDEREFFIRKAIGWVLREVGKDRPALVIDWLAPRAARASGVTMREAVRYLPPSDRRRLEARRNRQPYRA